MSQDHKLSLWQKIKQRLIQATRQSDTKALDAPVRDEAQATSPNAAQTSSGSPDNESHAATSDKKNAKDAAGQTDTSQEDARPTATDIVDYLKHYFDQQQWRYTHYRPKSSDPQRSHHLSLRMRNKQINCGYLFRIQESNHLLAVYGILPFLIPESHQSAAMLLMTQINYDMLIGNLEMDVNDGEIRYKHAIDVEAVGINDDIVEHLLQSVIAMTTVAYEIFNDLITTQNPSEDMPTLLLELRRQADARTFFLPTSFVQ